MAWLTDAFPMEFYKEMLGKLPYFVKLSHYNTIYLYLGENFQDYSWIQGFEADFP